MRAAIYARKSTEQAVADEAKSVTRQVEQARAFAEKNGWTVDPSHVYVDDAISGASFDRPGLTALLAAIARRPREIDVLVMMSTDRLGREMSETMRLQVQIVRSGVRIFHYQTGTELLLATPTDKLRASIDTFGAEDFRHQITLKVRDAMRRKAELGHSTGGNVLGYGRQEVLVNGKRSHVVRVVDPEQAEIVRRIFQMAADGLGFHRIAKRLNGAGVRNPTGRLSNGRQRKPSALWSSTGIRHVLRRKLYIGVMEYCQSRFAEPVRDDSGRERKLKVLRPASDWVTVAVPDCRIVSDELWQAAQDRMNRTKQNYIRQRDNGRLLGKPESGLASRFLLTGFVRCSACGSPLVRVNREGREGKDIFLCSLHHRRGKPGCAAKYTVPVRELTAAVVERLRARFAHPAAMDGMLAAAEAMCRPPDDADAQVRDLTGQVAKLDGELERLAEAVATGGAIPALLARLKDTQRRRNEVASNLAHLESLERGPGFDREDWQGFLGQLVAGLDHVFQLEPQAGRQVLRRLLGAAPIVVTITADGFSFRGLASPGAAAEYVAGQGANAFTSERNAWRL